MWLWLLSILACTSDGPDPVETGEQADEIWRDLAPGAVGPFQVGHQSIEHTYTAFDGDEPRTITIEVWYPTDDTSGVAAEYAIGSDSLSFGGAAPAAPIHVGGYPVHVHSHGYQGWGATSAFLMRHFASHGWVAVAPNHVGNLLTDHQDPLPNAHYIHKPRDIQVSLDVVATLELAGPIQTDEVVMSGHSFGASYGTWASAGASYDAVEASCADENGLRGEGPCTPSELAAFTSGTLKDERIKVAIPMAGTVRESFFGTTGYASVQGPVLYLSGTEDNPDGSQSQFETSTGIDLTWIELAGGCHQTFALGQCSTLDVPHGFDIVSTYSMAFARTHLLGFEGDSALLEGTDLPFSEVTLQLRRATD